jgi:predicted nucleic acid-binding protein
LQRIGQIGELITEVPARFSLPRDPDDAKYVDLAAVTQATHIVSRDKDLLDLMQDVSFRNEFPSLTILAPTEFLKLVRSDLPTGS